MEPSIDYLTEDPPISGQRFCLISIVGPNVPQKCDVWGMKIRGFAATEEAAKTLVKKIMRQENTFDIYTVDVGKFFPLAVKPEDVKDVEYQNEALNSLVKSYVQNRERANDHWAEQKNEMMSQAIKDGTKEMQEERAKKPEHPISVLTRLQETKTKLEKAQKDLQDLQSNVENDKIKFEMYSEEEREFAKKELEKAIENTVSESNSSGNDNVGSSSASGSSNVNQIKSDLITDLGFE